MGVRMSMAYEYEYGAQPHTCVVPKSAIRWEKFN